MDAGHNVGRRLGQYLGWVVTGALLLVVGALVAPAVGQDCGRHCPPPDQEPSLEERVAALERDHAALRDTVTTLQAENAELRQRLGAVETTVSPLRYQAAQNRLLIEGVNVQIVNGSGTTHGAPNGLGNVIVGYNAQRPGGLAAQRSGSHNLVVGDFHEWTHWGGLVAGVYNSILNEWATVTGGRDNIASGEDSTVSGGYTNHASGRQAAVSGGHLNIAGGFQSSVSGGLSNHATGMRASVSGGEHNHATGSIASVSGGESNTASGNHSSVLGGLNRTVSTAYGHHPG